MGTSLPYVIVWSIPQYLLAGEVEVIGANFNSPVNLFEK
jgi:hypothetical protein